MRRILNIFLNNTIIERNEVIHRSNIGTRTVTQSKTREDVKNPDIRIPYQDDITKHDRFYTELYDIGAFRDAHLLDKEDEEEEEEEEAKVNHIADDMEAMQDDMLFQHEEETKAADLQKHGELKIEATEENSQSEDEDYNELGSDEMEDMPWEVERTEDLEYISSSDEEKGE